MSQYLHYPKDERATPHNTAFTPLVDRDIEASGKYAEKVITIIGSIVALDLVTTGKAANCDEVLTITDGLTFDHPLFNGRNQLSEAFSRGVYMTLDNIFDSKGVSV